MKINALLILVFMISFFACSKKEEPNEPVPEIDTTSYGYFLNENETWFYHLSHTNIDDPFDIHLTYTVLRDTIIGSEIHNSLESKVLKEHFQSIGPIINGKDWSESRTRELLFIYDPYNREITNMFIDNGIKRVFDLDNLQYYFLCRTPILYNDTIEICNRKYNHFVNELDEEIIVGITLRIDQCSPLPPSDLSIVRSAKIEEFKYSTKKCEYQWKPSN